MSLTITGSIPVRDIHVCVGHIDICCDLGVCACVLYVCFQTQESHLPGGQWVWGVYLLYDSNKMFYINHDRWSYSYYSHTKFTHAFAERDLRCACAK